MPPHACGPGATSLSRGLADRLFRQDPVAAKCRETQFFFFSSFVLFFLTSLFLGPTDSGGRGGDRKHSSPVVYSSVCLTFTAQNHRRVWGSLARRSSSPSCLQRLKKAKTKNKQKKNPQKRKKKKQQKKRKSSPSLCSQPPIGDAAPSAWGTQGRCLADLSSPALQCDVALADCGSGRMATVIGTGQGALPCTPQDQAEARLTLQVQASGPGSTCLSSEERTGGFPPWFAAVFKAPKNCYFPLLQGALINQCGKTTGFLSMVL